MDFADIERILDLVRQHDLAEFELEREGLKLRVRKPRRRPAWTIDRHPRPPCGQRAVPVADAGPRAVAARCRRARRPPSNEESLELAVVKSPIVGTFYRAPEPGAPSFVEIGDQRQEGPGALHHRGDEADERDHLRVRRGNRQRLRGERQAVQYGSGCCDQTA